MTRYIHKASNETVELEKWRWEAYYTDGTCIKQFDKLDEENGEFHQFGEIDQSRLSHFKMVSDDLGKHYTLLFDPSNMKLIHFYRNVTKTVQVVTPEGQISNVGEPLTAKAYCFGFEANGYKIVNMITPSGEVITTNNPDRVSLDIPIKEVQ